MCTMQQRGCLSFNGGRSASKFRKSQICGLTKICLICGRSANVALCGFAISGPNLVVICGLKLPQARKYILILLTKMAYNTLAPICTVFPKRGLLGMFSARVAQHFVKRTAIRGLMIKKLRISDVRNGTHKKFADLRMYSLAETPQSHPFSRIWAHIRGRYWSDKIDDISSRPPEA